MISKKLKLYQLMLQGMNSDDTRDVAVAITAGALDPSIQSTTTDQILLALIEEVLALRQEVDDLKPRAPWDR